MKPEELERIYPFMKAMTEGKRVETRSHDDHPWVEVRSITILVALPNDQYRIVEPPNPLECWVNVFSTGVIYLDTKEAANLAMGNYPAGTFMRVGVHMVEAKEGE